MPTPTYTARCTRHRSLAQGVIEFTLEKPPGFSFRAGQFVMFQVPLAENPADVQGRAFSIASAPSEPGLLFVAKIKEGGRAGRWISESLRPGETVTFQGPLGTFLLDERSPKPILFLATCSGVAPFRSQITEALSRGDPRRMDLIFCVRREEELFWLQEFQAIAARHGTVRFHPTISQPSPSWHGHAGRVQAIAGDLIPDLPDRALYLCGNPEMVRAVENLALKEWGIPQADIHTEEYV